MTIFDMVRRSPGQSSMGPNGVEAQSIDRANCKWGGIPSHIVSISHRSPRHALCLCDELSNEQGLPQKTLFYAQEKQNGLC